MSTALHQRLDIVSPRLPSNAAAGKLPAVIFLSVRNITLYSSSSLMIQISDYFYTIAHSPIDCQVLLHQGFLQIADVHLFCHIFLKKIEKASRFHFKIVSRETIANHKLSICGHKQILRCRCKLGYLAASALPLRQSPQTAQFPRPK